MTNKITIGISGNQYSNGGSQPLIDIDSLFNLHAGRPFDSNTNSSFYVEVKHTIEYISYVFNLRPSFVHSVGANRDGVFWIALTIPSGMDVCGKDGNFISPLEILTNVFSIFSENYMQRMGNGSYEFKEGTCYRKPVDDYLDTLKLVPNPFMSPIVMDSNGGICYLSMDKDKMGLFLRNTQYPELSRYSSVIIAESVSSQSLFSSPIPRPLNINVKYRSTEIGEIDYYSKQEFRCIVNPDNTDTHESVEVHFSLSEFNGNTLTRSDFSAEIVKSPYGESYISVNPEFPAKSTFIPIVMEDSLWNDMYIENGKGDEIRASRPEGQSAYGFSLTGSQLRDVWELHHKGKLSDIVWNFVINGNVGLPTNPTLVATNKISIAEKVKRSLSENVNGGKAQTSTKGLNEPDCVDILSSHDIHHIYEKDTNAKLILYYVEGKKKIIVQKKIAYEIEKDTWELGAPYNPYLKGYQLEIQSREFTFPVERSGDSSALFTIGDKFERKKPFYQEIFDSVKEHSKIVCAAMVVLGVLLVVSLCCKFGETIAEGWDTFITDMLKRDTTNDGTSDGSNQGDKSTNAEVTTTVTIEDIKTHVKNLTYGNLYLSFKNLEDLLSWLPENQKNLPEVKHLTQICEEINKIQNGEYRLNSWLEYSQPYDEITQKPSSEKNILRKNIQSLRKIDGVTYKALNEALKPLYLMGPNYDSFQQKYIILNIKEQTNDNTNRLKSITTFSGILQLHAAFIKGEDNKDFTEVTTIPKKP